MLSSVAKVTSFNDVFNVELDLAEIFPFVLDPFQIEAIDSLKQGYSVVVSAPTGSGKTLIGEYAIYRAIAHGQKVLYTTPLKALSNQKLRDFRNQFGSKNVGLLTGDLSVTGNLSVTGDLSGNSAKFKTLEVSGTDINNIISKVIM